MIAIEGNGAMIEGDDALIEGSTGCSPGNKTENNNSFLRKGTRG